MIAPLALEPDDPLRLVAVAPFTVTLDISADGRYLARTACRGAAGCGTSLIELSSKEILEFPNLTVTDVGIGGMIVADACGAAGCTTKLIDVESGAARDLPGSAWDTTVMTLDDGPVVIESFTSKVKTIARAAAIWRSFETSQDALAENGLTFLRGLLGSRAR